MSKILFVAFGGAIGSVLRYIASELDYNFAKLHIMLSTMIVNTSGSLIIGFLWGLFERVDISPGMRAFIFIGILGGYTTFSSFSLENLHLLRIGNYKLAAINILVTNILSLIFVFLGFVIAKVIISFLKTSV